MAVYASAKLNEDACPVPEDLFGDIHRAQPTDAIEIAKTLPETQRARLAAFCYNRRHLHALGLLIASTCEAAALYAVAGPAGEAIFSQSRDPEKTLAKEMQPPGSRPPKKITLAEPAST
jgi:hypothetical protein